jgi:hypothetical protein
MTSIREVPYGIDRDSPPEKTTLFLRRTMKKRALSLFVVTVMSFAILSGAPAPQEDMKDRIIKATKTLAGPPDPSATKEDIVSALLELLDIAAAIVPDNQYKEEIKYRIDVAKDLIKKDSLFNEKARQYLSFAYRMMTNGKKFEKPKDLEEFVTPAELQEKSIKYVKSLVDKALGSLRAGNKGETAKLLLELVLMTVTPIAG